MKDGENYGVTRDFASSESTSNTCCYNLHQRVRHLGFLRRRIYAHLLCYGRVEEATTDGSRRWSRLWTKIRSLVCLSVLPLADVVPGGPGHGSCFELFGFDIMVDSKLNRCFCFRTNIFMKILGSVHPQNNDGEKFDLEDVHIYTLSVRHRRVEAREGLRGSLRATFGTAKRSTVPSRRWP